MNERSPDFNFEPPATGETKRELIGLVKALLGGERRVDIVNEHANVQLLYSENHSQFLVSVLDKAPAWLKESDFEFDPKRDEFKVLSRLDEKKVSRDMSDPVGRELIDYLTAAAQYEDPA